MSDRLLLDEQPLIVLPQLARLIGLNEAIILQQVHYWVSQNEKAKRNFHDDHYWTFNSYPQWQKQFPFWSLATIRRTMASLERSGHLITGTYNRMAGDRSKWYRINYSRMGVSTPSAQNEHPICSDCAPHLLNMSAPLPETTQRLTTEITTTTGNPMVDALFLLQYWKPDPEGDVLWLAEFSLEFPDFSLQHIKECRDFHDGRRARHKGDWKNRLRNWMKIDTQRKGKHEQRTKTDQRNLISNAEELARTWEDS